MKFILLVSIQIFLVLLAEDFRIESKGGNTSFAAVYNPLKPVDGNFIFGDGVFSEANVIVDSPTEKLTLTGGADTKYETVSATCAFDIVRAVSVRFIALKFTSSLPHSQSYFRATNGIDIYFNNCLITNITACTNNNPLLILNEKGAVKLEIYNSEIKTLSLGNFSRGGLIHVTSNSWSNAVFENVRFFDFAGGNLTNGVIVFNGTAGGGQVNFTKCIIDSIAGIGEYGFLFSSWNVNIGTSSFSGLLNMGSGCLYVSGINIILTVVASSFLNIQFKKRGAVYFSGRSHSYTEVNMTNILNASEKAYPAGIVSRSLSITRYHQCRFTNLRAYASTTIDQQLSGGIEIAGCKFSKISAMAGRPAGIAAVPSPSTIDIHDSEFDSLYSDDSSTVAYVQSKMTWNSVTIWNCTGSRNGAVFCQRGDLTCDNCTFTNLKSERDGGVLHHHSGSMSITRSRFENCYATRYGGALYAPGRTYFFSGCEFKNNVAGHSNGGNDIFFSPFSSSTTMNKDKMYGCCSTSKPPRVNNQKSGNVDIYLPTCTGNTRYVAFMDGKNTSDCGSTPYSACKNLAHCGKVYASFNPLNIILSGESFSESSSLIVVARRIQVTGDLNRKTLLKCVEENTALIDITTGSFVGNNLTFDAARLSSVSLTTKALYVHGVGQATLRDSLFMSSANTTVPLGGPVVFVDNTGAVVTFERVVFRWMSVTDNSAVYLHCNSASFSACDFYNLTSSSTKNFSGGAVTFVNGGLLKVEKSSFKNCNTTLNGGAVYISDSSFSFDSIVFQQCTASAGGAIYYSASASSGYSVFFALCNFLGNQASSAKQGNDIRDENGNSRWSASNVVACCSDGVSNEDNFRFSIGASSSLKSNDIRLPTCSISPCNRIPCPKECTLVGGICTENECTRTSGAKICPEGCIMFAEGTSLEYCYLDMCAPLTEKDLCEKNHNCVWENGTCHTHNCTTPPGEVCPTTEGCVLKEGICVECKTGNCSSSTEGCDLKNSSDLCEALTDPKCIWLDDTCLWDPCASIIYETSCLSHGCTWTTKCEWNKCVFMWGENPLTAPCYDGCQRDSNNICSVDICEDKNATECNATDCVWNAATDKCNWHECVRLHNELKCYAGCIMEGDKCVVDKCKENGNEKDCDLEEHCVWVSEGPTNPLGECVWNYCEEKCEDEIPEGCKKNAIGKCVPDECTSVSSSVSGCPIGCEWDSKAQICKVSDDICTGSGSLCYAGCFNTSGDVCKQAHVCTFLDNHCIWNPCQVYNPTSSQPCPIGCEKDPKTDQCVPDRCIIRYWPYLDCENDEECSVEIASVFRKEETCVYNSQMKSQSGKVKKFPWWIILVGLLIVAVAVIALISLLVYQWRKKKDTKTKMQIQDVGGEEMSKRNSDEMDILYDDSGYSGYTDATSNASSGYSDASGYSGYTNANSDANTSYTGYSGYNKGSGSKAGDTSASGYSGYTGSTDGYSDGTSSSRSYSNPTVNGNLSSHNSHRSKSKSKKHSSASESGTPFGSTSVTPSKSGYASPSPSRSASGIVSGSESMPPFGSEASGYSSASHKGTKSRGSASGSRSRKSSSSESSGSHSLNRSKSSSMSSRSKRSSNGSAAGSKSKTSTSGAKSAASKRSLSGSKRSSSGSKRSSKRSAASNRSTASQK